MNYYVNKKVKIKLNEPDQGETYKNTHPWKTKYLNQNVDN